MINDYNIKIKKQCMSIISQIKVKCKAYYKLINCNASKHIQNAIKLNIQNGFPLLHVC